MKQALKSGGWIVVIWRIRRFKKQREKKEIPSFMTALQSSVGPNTAANQSMYNDCSRHRTCPRALPAIPLVFFVCALAFAVSARADTSNRPGRSPPAALNEQILYVPVQTSPPVSLEVTVYMPSRGGPFPLALVNHGASKNPPTAPTVADEFIPFYFLSRGYAIAMPMMRGYARSGGKLAPHGCDVISIGLDAAHDIRAVLDRVKGMPGVDSSRIVVAGKSMGGWATLVFGSLNPPDVRGLLNFAGGVKESDCRTPDQSLVTSAGQIGARARLRSLWLYGENDLTFTTPTWQGMFRGYTAAGGPAELVDYGRFQNDAHAMTASGAGLPLWVQKTDAFLASIGMPGQELNPEYLPGRAPAATAYANINDLGAVPYLSDVQKEKLYRQFLAAPLPRAIAIGRTNGAYFTPSWTAISRQAGQAFHAKVGTDFTASWTAISREAGQ
jgi:dienelactone hydrolase